MKGGEKWWSFEISQVSHRLKKKNHWKIIFVFYEEWIASFKMILHIYSNRMEKTRIYKIYF